MIPSDVLQGASATVTLTEKQPVTCHINYSQANYQMRENDGLTITTNGYGTFQDKFEISFYKPVQIDGEKIDSVSIRVDEDGQLKGHISIIDGGWYDQDSRILTETTDEATGITTYRFMDLTDSCSFHVKFSADRKTISFPDITEEVIKGNSIDVQTYVK